MGRKPYDSTWVPFPVYLVWVAVAVSVLGFLTLALFDAGETTKTVVTSVALSSVPVAGVTFIATSLAWLGVWNAYNLLRGRKPIYSSVNEL